MAIQHLAALRQGVDPLAKRDVGREAVTVRDLAARFDAEHIIVHLKPSTQKEYRRSLKKVILLLWQPADRRGQPRGGRPLPPQAPARSLPGQPLLEILSKMFNLAELWGLRPNGSNPRKHIKKYREEKHERFLSAADHVSSAIARSILGVREEKGAVNS
jgi:hypothetical protein